MRVGTGYDIHRLVEGRKLLLGGVALEAAKGESGHSDGDVLIHAVIDALLGAAGIGDIGLYFPPSDPQYKDISSRKLLREVSRLIREAGYRIVNIDSTVILENPRIRPYVDEIRATLGADLGIPSSQVSVKGKTKEGVDATGSGDAVEAHAVALLEEVAG